MSEIHYFKVFFTMYDDVTARGGGRTRSGAMANSAAQWQTMRIQYIYSVAQCSERDFFTEPPGPPPLVTADARWMLM
jgi:hypothetical protein